MLNPYYFTDKVLQVGFNNSLGSHLLNHAISKKNIKPNHPVFRIEHRCINQIMEKISYIHARLMNRYEFKYQTVFLVSLINKMKIIKY